MSRFETSVEATFFVLGRRQPLDVWKPQLSRCIGGRKLRCSKPIEYFGAGHAAGSVDVEAPNQGSDIDGCPAS